MMWLKWLVDHIGEKEIPGTKENNHWIVELFKWTSYRTNFDETPWCAACMNAALEETGYRGSKSAAAKSFINLGIKCELQPGALVVVSRAPGRYHITCCYRIIDDHYFYGVGGNQNNELNCTIFQRSKIVAIRWPEKK